MDMAFIFDETFGTGSAFNAEVFVAAPHAIAMEFDLFGEGRLVIGVKSARGKQKETSGWIGRLRIAKSLAWPWFWF